MTDRTPEPPVVCFCGPRDCLHPSNLRDGVACKVAQQARHEAEQQRESAVTLWSLYAQSTIHAGTRLVPIFDVTGERDQIAAEELIRLHNTQVRHLEASLARVQQAAREVVGWVEHEADCEALPSLSFKCSGCGYVTATRTEDDKAYRACKGYCQDPDCGAAWPCPACGRRHYWGGHMALKRACTCGLDDALAALTGPPEDQP